MEVTKELNGKELTLHILGTMDSISSGRLQEVFEEALSENGDINSLVLDLTGLEYVVSEGLRRFLQIARDMSGRGEIRAYGAKDVVAEILAMTGIGAILNLK